MSKDDITWPQLSRWWPILAGCIAITLSYATLVAQIAITNVKLDNAIALLKDHEERNSAIITNLNDLNKRVVAIETEHASNRK